MQNENLIPANECCIHYNIELSFINALQEYGLLEMIAVKQKQFIDENALKKLEKFARMHYELNINMEGIEAIDHLLERVEKMQEEILSLKNKINFLSSTPDSFSELF